MYNPEIARLFGLFRSALARLPSAGPRQGQATRTLAPPVHAPEPVDVHLVMTNAARDRLGRAKLDPPARVRVLVLAAARAMLGGTRTITLHDVERALKKL